jgi:hypothetical protein
MSSLVPTIMTCRCKVALKEVLQPPYAHIRYFCNFIVEVFRERESSSLAQHDGHYGAEFRVFWHRTFLSDPLRIILKVH